MKKAVSILLLLALCLGLFGCGKTPAEETGAITIDNPVETTTETPTEATPEEEEGYSLSYHFYRNPEADEPGKIAISGSITEKPKSRSCSVLLLEDGLPVEFSVDGETYLSYPLPSDTDQFTMQCPMEFSLNMGRADVYLQVKEKNGQIASHGFRVPVEMEGEAKTPEKLWETEHIPLGLQGGLDGGAYDAWLLTEEAQQEKVTPRYFPEGIDLKAGEPLLFMARASRKGMYRTVLMLDTKPLDFIYEGETCSYIDWEYDGTNMLQIPITLPEGTESGNFYTIFTSMEGDTSLFVPPYNQIYLRIS